MLSNQMVNFHKSQPLLSWVEPFWPTLTDMTLPELQIYGEQKTSQGPFALPQGSVPPPAKAPASSGRVKAKGAVAFSLSCKLQSYCKYPSAETVEVVEVCRSSGPCGNLTRKWKMCLPYFTVHVLHPIVMFDIKGGVHDNFMFHRHGRLPWLLDGCLVSAFPVGCRWVRQWWDLQDWVIGPIGSSKRCCQHPRRESYPGKIKR